MDEVKVHQNDGVTVFMAKYLEGEQVEGMPKQSQPDHTKREVSQWISAYQLHRRRRSPNQLVLHYKNLVESIARKYSKGKSYHEDIFQVGIIGLLGQFAAMMKLLESHLKHLQFQPLLVKSNGSSVIKHGVFMCRAELRNWDQKLKLLWKN